MLRAAMFEAVPENAVRFLGHEAHEHSVPHLIHVVSGTADIVVDETPVRLRPHENLWIGPDVPHSARYSHDGVVLGPFLSPSSIPPGRFRTLGVVPRLTEIARIILGASPRTDEQISVFREALDDVLRALDTDYFALRLPTHPIARQLAHSAATSDRTLEQFAAGTHTSVRQLQRVFLNETELPFTRWRTRAKLNIAIRRLQGGDSLPAAAHIAGYASRAGLLKSLEREARIPLKTLAADPIAALSTPQ